MRRASTGQRRPGGEVYDPTTKRSTTADHQHAGCSTGPSPATRVSDPQAPPRSPAGLPSLFRSFCPAATFYYVTRPTASFPWSPSPRRPASPPRHAAHQWPAHRRGHLDQQGVLPAPTVPVHHRRPASFTSVVLRLNLLPRRDRSQAHGGTLTTYAGTSDGADGHRCEHVATSTTAQPYKPNYGGGVKTKVGVWEEKREMLYTATRSHSRCRSSRHRSPQRIRRGIEVGRRVSRAVAVAGAGQAGSRTEGERRGRRGRLVHRARSAPGRKPVGPVVARSMSGAPVFGGRPAGTPASSRVEGDDPVHGAVGLGDCIQLPTSGPRNAPDRNDRHAHAPETWGAEIHGVDGSPIRCRGPVRHSPVLWSACYFIAAWWSVPVEHRRTWSSAGRYKASSAWPR